MARTNVPITTLASNGAVAYPTPTTADPTNGHIVPAGGKMRDLFIRILNTAAATKLITIAAGVNPPSVRKGTGALTFTIAATTGDALLGPFEAARFAQADGSIWVDVAAGWTGSIIALRLAKT